ncbi:hypothetical protein ED733_007092 [Metarhizium rileyi]|uniref:FAD-binding domain-containing protein n=1 Tax=Metarhizium rileyi (strain RCEF 4871) TaxID=1649241 RepID=A0A5C6GI67_METRR|nr:hypothetical protein ED733_007092 [Metarhizium rileyi]
MADKKASKLPNETWQQSPKPFEKVLIVGAGPAGLLLSILLAQGHIPSTVLESWDRVDEKLRAMQYGVPATKVFRRSGILDDRAHIACLFRMTLTRLRSSGTGLDTEYTKLTADYKGFEDHGWEGEKQHLERCDLAFKKMLPGHPDPSQYRVTQTDGFRIHNRCVEKMRVGRVFLVGEAAYVCNPFGGYGCMAAVLDVTGLADCLIGYYEGKDDEDILKFIDRRSRKNLDRISKTSADTALETDPFLALLESMRGDADETRKFLLKVRSIEFDFTTLYKSPAAASEVP